MRRTICLVIATSLALLAVPLAPAGANDADVIRRGACTAGSTWKLKVSPENGALEVEFEVDQNKVDEQWRVALRHDGERFFLGRRTTRAPSGSFEVRRVTSDGAGEDVIVGRARNLRTDEVCRGRVVFA